MSKLGSDGPSRKSFRRPRPLKEARAAVIETFGRYEVRGLVGEGSMGRVYRAFDPLAKRIVAVKTLKWEYYSSTERAEYLRRFRRETQAAASLAHPNVITVFDVGEDYFVMELLEGQTLQKLLHERGRLGLAEALRVLAPVAEGIDYAHIKGIIHRDIKPSNIMILPDGRPKLMDFGVAHLSSTTITATGEFLGSPSYMAPEQITSSTASSRTDLFSFGVVAYEVLTGARPFQGESIAQIVHRVVNADPAPPSSVNLALPAHYDDVFSRALAKDPGVRFPSATALVAALGRRSADSAAAPARPAAAKPPSEAACAEVETEDLWAGAPAQPGLAPGASRSRGAGPRTARRWLAIAALLAAAAVLGTRLRAPAPAPAPTGQPSSAGIEVATEPLGAEVRVDGSSMGRTPLTLAGLKPGPHTVAVSLRGFSTAELSLVLPPGPMPVPLRFMLLPLEARLQVTSVPAGAAVSVDGKAAGSTPLASLAVPPGVRQVEMRQKGFRPWAQTIEARAGDTVPLLAHLEPESEPKDLRAALKLGGWVHEGDLVELGPGVSPPRRVSGAAPAYPEAARKLRLEGTVIVEMIVTERGDPIDLTVVESAGEVLDAAVLAAVRTWRYAPAEKDGVKVRVRQRVRERFSFAG